ncbi:MAG: DEAD/DEAH box helicase [Luteolibacter sp.]|nr:DEAD/DEAH box helicase [Luteolibacter sp.]
MIQVSYAALLAQNPDLIPWFVSGMWKEEIPISSLRTGGLAVQHLVILDPETEDCDLLVGAEVRDAKGRLHSLSLLFFFDEEYEEGPIDFASACSCSTGYGCQHTAASLELLASIAATSGPARKTPANPLIDAWLFKIKQAEQASAASAVASHRPVKPYNKFLAYCIEFHTSPYTDDRRPTPYFCMRIGSLNKSGGHNIEASHAAADPSKPAKYMAAEDLAICAAFHARKRKTGVWGSDIPLGGADWDALLDSAMATGRLFFLRTSPNPRSSRIHLRLTEGPPLPVNAGWELMEDGSASPILTLPSPGIEIIPTQPLRYIDPVELVFGILQSETPHEILAIWPLGPPIPAAAIPDINAELRSIPTATPLPTPAEKPAEILSDLAPAPILQITWVHVGVFQKRHIGGLVKFQYPGCPVLSPLPRGAPPQTSWIDGDKRMILQRDIATETSLLDELAQCGLDSIGGHYPERELSDKNRHSFVLGGLLASAANWLEFLTSPEAEQLRANGWIIEGDPKLGLVIHDIGDFFPAIEADPDHGIDWFRFDVTGEFDGRRVSLIPQIAAAIAGDWHERYKDPESMPETLLLPCDNPADGHIRFPAKRFLEIVDQVRHLFHGKGGADGPLRMDRLSAAGVAHTFAIESSETTRALATLGRNLRDIQGLPPAEVPATIKAELRPYQTDGFRWLQFLANHGLHGILADDMGLGKTLQTLAHLAAETSKFPDRPSLVIAPTSVVPNWAAETEKFAPHLKMLVLHGGERADHFEKIGDHHLVLTTYPLLVRDFEILAKHHWHTLVLDEAQYIKNPKSITAYSACRLKANHRICLSGTPMENHLGELWSLMRFLMPGFLADEKTFNTFLRKPIERDHSTDAQIALNRRVSPLILRRTKDQVATELPEKTTLIHGIDLTPKQTDLYESVRAAMDARVRDAIADKGLAKSHIIVLDALLKLRQICCHPHLLKSEAARRVTESAKLEYLTSELLPQLIEEGRRILLFSQFTSMLELIEEHLELEDIPFLKLTGQTKERAQLVKKFQTGEIPIFLISLKAGGTGLNLTAADTVIHYDPWRNPAAENQATDRAHRIGQTKPVFVHKLVCRGTIEDRILELQKQKSTLVEALLSEDTTKLRIDAETLSHLLAPLS